MAPIRFAFYKIKKVAEVRKVTDLFVGRFSTEKVTDLFVGFICWQIFGAA
jgi:hypothetical protein